MKTEIRIEAEMTDEQCDALLSELMNTAEVIGIKLKVESNKLHQDVDSWWTNLQPHEQQELADKYFPDNMFGALSLDSKEISSIYQSEYKI